MASTLLDQLEEQLNVDVDWMDPEYIASLPFKPHDQTSNQLWVDIQLGHESNRELLLQTASELKHDGWLAIYTRMSCLMCKKNMDLIQDRVLLQTLPSNAYSTDKTVEHARLYDREFARVGIPRGKYCIKIPCTGPAMAAAKILTEDGIPTLGTALFGFPQAIAASQAGCMFISPYYNEVRAHEERQLWKDYDDPAMQHPMSARVLNILALYTRMAKETGKMQPLLKNASFLSVKEAMACAELGCHSATLSPAILDQLRSMPGVTRPGDKTRLACLLDTDTLSGKWDPNLVDTSVDYLSDGGARLDAAIAADSIASARLKDALGLFIAAEERSKARIEQALTQV